MKKFIAVFAIVAGSVLFAAPAALANGDVIDTTTETPAPTETPADPPTEETPAEETPAEETPAETPAAEESLAPPAGTESGLGSAKIVIQAASEKIEICHATASHSNPYVVNKPAASSKIHEGHGSHTGPIWFEGIQVEWGDIIPPFDYPGGSFPGLNWTDAGQAIYDNGCKAVEGEDPTPVTPLAPSATDPTCDADGELVIPEIEGIEYIVDPEPYDEPGTYDITPQALPGFELIGGPENGYEITVEEQLTGDECGEIEAEEGLLPDTGGSSPWLFLGAASMIAGGYVLLRKKQSLPVVPGYRLDI